VDLVADLLPALHWPVQLKPFGEPHGAVEYHPRHDLGVGVVASRAAAFPDPVVRFAPDRLDMLDDCPPARPVPLLDRAHLRRAEEPDRHDFPVDVELELIGGGVADTHRL
jgi:hypothetical protein